MKINSYSKIYNLGHKAIIRLFDESVVLQEKIDGSQISFCRVGDELFMRSKRKQIVIDAPEKMFQQAVDAVLNVKHLLHDGWIYRGEYLSKPKHNALAYDRIPDNHIIIFDIDAGNQIFFKPVETQIEANLIGFECVPCFESAVKIDNLDQFKELLDKQSVLGGQKIEGVVIKNYNRFTIDGKTMMGKYVSDEYREISRKDWKSRNPGKGDIIQIIGQSLRTESRWSKSIIHLKEQGLIMNDPQDIGMLLKEIKMDTAAETIEMVKDKLYKWAWPKISRIITAGFPEWYKEQLTESQFSKNEEEDEK